MDLLSTHIVQYHIRLFKFKFIKTEQNENTTLVIAATFQVLNHHMCLGTTVLDSVDIERG